MFTGILLILDIKLHDYFLHKYTFQVDSEAVLVTHMEICRDIFIIVSIGFAIRLRKFIAKNMLVRPLLPIYVCIFIDVLSKYYIFDYYKLTLHPLTILAVLIGILQSLILLTIMYLLCLLSPPVIRFWLFQFILVGLIFITLFDVAYFKITETHVQSILFSNISHVSIKGAISNINTWYLILLPLALTLLSKINLWSIKGIVSVDKFRKSLICYLPILVTILILTFTINTKCIAIDRDLGENFGTIYIRLEKTRQQHRNILSVSPLVNLIQERYADKKDDERIFATKPFIAYTDKERHFLKSLGLIKKIFNKPALNNNQNYRTIVLIVFESLHADYLHVTNPTIPAEATPYFDQLLRDYPHLDNYFTSAIPTTLGLNASFISQIRFTPEFSKMHHPGTLFSLLAKRGLDGYFISGVSSDHQDERSIYPKLFRINHYIAKEEMDKRYRGASGWGYHDDIVLQEGLRVLKEHKGQSTFLVMKLIDLHQPGEYCGLPPSELPEVIKNLHNDVINTLYWENQCLENFFNQVKSYGLFNSDTLFVITADHGPFLGSQKLARLENRRMLSKIPLIFISPNVTPFKNLNQVRLASQIDLAPTLLSVMGIESPPYFLGNSVLSQSPGFAIGLWENMLYFGWKKGEVNMPIVAEEQGMHTSALKKFLNNMYSDYYLKNGSSSVPGSI